MQLAGILHRPESEDTAVLADHQVLIRLQTAQDIQSVTLKYADMYLWQAGAPMKTTTMQRGLATQAAQYWTLTVTVPTNRLIYGFQITGNDGKTIGYGDDGLFTDEATQWAITGHYFHLPYLHVSDAELPPAWVKDTVWYQIFPERFANGDQTNDPAKVQPWGQGPVQRDSFYGGDLRGIIDHLDDLADLGINGLYLCPIFTSPSNHKYDTLDHFEIDPHFGTKRDFQELVDAAHDRGMRVMLDAVFNHFGTASPQWQDVVKNGAQSRFADWFHIHDFPVGQDAKTGELNYETFGTAAMMPKLNTQNPAVRDYLIEITSYWLRQLDIDAWRFDVADEVDHGTWRAICAALRAVKPDVYLLGESWHTSASLVGNGQFDAVMNYPLTQPILSLFNQTVTIADYVGKTNLQLCQYRQPNQQVMFNALDTHDTARALTVLQDDPQKVQAALTLMMLLPGAPCLYYGTEAGLAGGPDPDNRRCMPWEPAPKTTAMYPIVQKLVKWRRSQTEFLATSQLSWQIHDGWLQLIRKDATQTVVGSFNLSQHSQTSAVVGKTIVSAGLTGDQLAADGFSLQVLNKR
ncbi:glycoside hydrolase family 13 protein [Lactiplantibacillus mudanjiangensis]|uniref:Alpha-glycosidase [Lactobacillus sp.] n=1 Tax=Lactiplantibacillus mudanjiangensis TaxID=1296538 RepID=A0A660DWC3_9LACO|nr:glycoside hydrolase family 13 protein [Lactiplantibacillus mudanjiangensis]VDG25382.1 alpha-glycosidase [Lactobacillus sp.] [Lactiplantibacillus mudanjiangensis]VDG27587.1 alpha-glycosidase [Lactobacillus sp.] [Lactiplantibacillus mudanjiangensis]